MSANAENIQNDRIPADTVEGIVQKVLMNDGGGEKETRVQKRSTSRGNETDGERGGFCR